MKKDTKRTKALQGKRLLALSLATLLSFEGFSTNKLANLHNAIVNADPHHYFLTILVASFLILATWKHHSNKAENKTQDKNMRLNDHKRIRIRSGKTTRIKPITIDIMGL